MTVDSGDAEAPRVVLYDSAGPVSGTGGVVVRVPQDNGPPALVALVAPWPASLGYSTPFAVAVNDGASARTVWCTPRKVDIFGFQGADLDTNVGAITLTAPPTLSAPDSSVAAAQLAQELTTSRNVRQSLGGFSRFAPVQAGAPMATTSPAPAAAPETAVPQSFRATVSDVQSVTDGLCRIFRWD
ncbi:hypothetical protein [Kribbella sp. VKM Ac-2568]|uniref:hypothetical protein n=1 Tax=Kribbella sp. VKM Ac-2568 TaxID=2512219 RepID=UPI00104F546C|nr:hypothetical protein [Kribbella sp. VKM Ac-2568]TCM38927.1 hypothetical protein EV648_11544 [Kribbella sp. VKM Ac-2568]